MKQWHHSNSPPKRRELRKVRRRSHTVAKSQFSVNMHDETSSVREETGQRVQIEELFDDAARSGSKCCILL